MRNQKAFLLAAIVLMSSSIAGADLILTLNGNDLSDSPLIQNLGELLVAVEGTTQIEPNDVSVSAVGGVLEPVPDANHEYYFEFDAESSEATISLITNVDMVIDGNSIAAGTTIYELWVFCNREQNILAACGMPLEDLIPPEGESGSEPNDNDGTGETDKHDSGMATQEPNEPNGPSEPNDPQEPNIPDSLFKPRNDPPPLLLHCPDGSIKPYRLEEFDYPSVMSEKNFEASGFTTLGGAGYVELQEIASSQFLDPNVTYYVPYPPLLIHGVGGEEIDVLIPSGTTIVLAEDWDYGIVIYDGANVYFGEPAPNSNEPNDIQPPGDTNNPVEPVWIVGESGDPFFNNYCGILVDRTAGTRCLLNNIYLSGFQYGIFADQQLEYPISNIYSLGCYNGIFSFGSNKIMNSYVSYFGEWSAGWQYYGLAYCFIPESFDGSIAFVKPDFEIYNCLADDGDDGFTVYGVPDEPNTPNFYSRDCAAANCYSGFNGWDSYVAFSIICPGLYNNYQNKNFPEMPFTDPVYETNDPFVVDPNDYRIFLDPNSQFVDHGSSLSPFPGWTTKIDGKPDEGVGDIWLHYQTTKMDMYPTANLNWDESVDMLDLVEFAEQWLVPDPVSADFDNDGIANFADFAVLAGEWMLSDMAVEILDLETQATIDPNNVHGHVGIYLEDVPLYGGIISIYVENLLIGDLWLDWDNENNWVGLESDIFSNGWHTIRVVTTDLWGNIINHKPVKVFFNNLLYKVAGSDHFHPTEDYKYSGFYDGGNTLDAQVTNQDGQVIWSNTYSGPHISIVVPGATFGSEQFCQLTITETESAMMATGESTTSSSTVTSKDLTREFRQADWPNGARMVIVLPNKDVFKARKPAIIECAEACEARGVTWLALYHKNVTQQNLTYLYNKSGVKYIYWCGHANSHVGRNERLKIDGVQRTHTECWKHTVRNWWPDKWEKIGVFSHFYSQEPLPNDWDNRGFSLWSLGMHDSGNKKIVFIDGCWSAFNWDGVRNDMAEAYGMYSLWNAGHHDQIYIGWRVEVLTAAPGSIWDPVLFSTDGVKLFWKRMGLGDDVYNALSYTASYGGWGIQTTLWGPNGLMDFHEPYEDSDDNIWIYGEGIHAELEP